MSAASSGDEFLSKHNSPPDSKKTWKALHVAAPDNSQSYAKNAGIPAEEISASLREISR